MAGGPRAYDAFISYSQRADGDLAPVLQRSLERLSRPWYRRKPFLRVVRDATTFGATSDLTGTIRTALDGAAHLVLLVSPESASSTWTNEEVRHWLTTKDESSLTVVITRWAVDDDRADGTLTPLSEFDWDGPDVPASLHAALDVPLAVDLRWVDDPSALSLDDGRWKDAVAQIAAAIRGQDKDELIGELVALRTRARIITGAIGMALLILVASVVVAVAQWMVAQREVDEARVERDALRAESDQLAEDIATQRLVSDSRALTAESVLYRTGTQRELALLLGLAGLDRAERATGRDPTAMSLSEPTGILLESVDQQDRSAVAEWIDVSPGITAIAGPVFDDVFVTGGDDGTVRLWRIAASGIEEVAVEQLGFGRDCQGQSSSTVASLDVIERDGRALVLTGAGAEAAAGATDCAPGGRSRLDLWEVHDADGPLALRHLDVALEGQGHIGGARIDRSGCDDDRCAAAAAGVVDGDHRLWVFDVAEGTLALTGDVARNDVGPVRDVSWAGTESFEGRRAVSVTTVFAPVRLFDVTDVRAPSADPELQAAYDGQIGSRSVGLGTSAQWHPSDPLLLTTSEDGIARIHDFRTEGPADATDRVVQLPGPTAFTVAVWHPDIPIVIAGSIDESAARERLPGASGRSKVWIWDVTDPGRPRRLLAPMELHERDVTALATDGEYLVSGSKGFSAGSNRLVISAVGSDRIRAAACELVTRELTREERLVFLGDPAPVELCS